VTERLVGMHLRGEELLFYQAAGRGELIYGRCAACNEASLTPRWFCTSCGSEDMIASVSARHGVVESVTTVHRGNRPAFKAPYQVALITLDEGFRLMASVIGEGCAIGESVVIEFDAQPDGLAVPVARKGSQESNEAETAQ
jgi:uncharacterized OB-fold protein